MMKICISILDISMHASVRTDDCITMEFLSRAGVRVFLLMIYNPLIIKQLIWRLARKCWDSAKSLRENVGIP